MVDAIRMCTGAGYVRCQVLIVQGCCVEVLLLDKLGSRSHAIRHRARSHNGRCGGPVGL
jgi:hypothetical protein